MSIFSERLKKLRKDKKLSQQNMADTLNINRGSYTNWELGKREPNIETIIKLAWELDSSIDYLLGTTNINYGREHATVAPPMDLETANTALEHLELTKKLQGLSEEEYNHQKSNLQNIINDWKNWEKKAPHENRIGTNQTKPNETTLNDL